MNVIEKSDYLEVDPSNMLKKYIFLDNNLFRRLKNNPQFYESFFKFIEKHKVDLLDNVKFLFTIQQFIEDADQKWVISDITPKLSPFPKTCINIEQINKHLEKYFKILVSEIEVRLPKHKILEKIETSVKSWHSPKHLLFQETLSLFMKNIRESDSLIDFYHELAWQVLVSYPFVSSQFSNPQVFELQNIYFDALFSVWHRYFLEGIELDLYRLISTHYFKNITQSNQKAFKGEEVNNVKLKPKNDLCDSLLINLVMLGKKDTNNQRFPVTAMTLDTSEILERRIAISKTQFNALSAVNAWQVQLVPGSIVSFKLVNEEPVSAIIIPFDAKLKDKLSQ